MFVGLFVGLCVMFDLSSQFTNCSFNNFLMCMLWTLLHQPKISIIISCTPSRFPPNTILHRPSRSRCSKGTRSIPRASSSSRRSGLEKLYVCLLRVAWCLLLIACCCMTCYCAVAIQFCIQHDQIFLHIIHLYSISDLLLHHQCTSHTCSCITFF